MSDAANPSTEHPAPQADRVQLHESFFALFGGPIAWFLQLCAGYALTSDACFKGSNRTWEPIANLRWTGALTIYLMLAAVGVSLVALAISWSAYRRTQDEAGGQGQHLMETGAGRTRFLALWGICLAAGFATATATTAVAFLTVSRCAG